MLTQLLSNVSPGRPIAEMKMALALFQRRFSGTMILTLPTNSLASFVVFQVPRIFLRTSSNLGVRSGKRQRSFASQVTHAPFAARRSCNYARCASLVPVSIQTNSSLSLARNLTTSRRTSERNSSMLFVVNLSSLSMRSLQFVQLSWPSQSSLPWSQVSIARSYLPTAKGLPVCCIFESISVLTSPSHNCVRCKHEAKEVTFTAFTAVRSCFRSRTVVARKKKGERETKGERKKKGVQEQREGARKREKQESAQEKGRAKKSEKRRGKREERERERAKEGERNREGRWKRRGEKGERSYPELMGRGSRERLVALAIEVVGMVT